MLVHNNSSCTYTAQTVCSLLLVITYIQKGETYRTYAVYMQSALSDCTQRESKDACTLALNETCGHTSKSALSWWTADPWHISVLYL